MPPRSASAALPMPVEAMELHSASALRVVRAVLVGWLRAATVGLASFRRPRTEAAPVLTVQRR